jgi:hypothetical protein
MELTNEEEKEPLDDYLRRDLLKNLVTTAETYNLGELSTTFDDRGYKVSVNVERIVIDE